MPQTKIQQHLIGTDLPISMLWKVAYPGFQKETNQKKKKKSAQENLNGW